MKIENKTKKKVLAKNFKFCSASLSKFLGLMFSFNMKKPLIFKFNRENFVSLHMLFVFFPIDVLFLNGNKTVVDKKENFMPFTFYKSKKKSAYVIELPSGTIKKADTDLGDKIEF